MLDILTLIDKIIKQIRQLIQFFETKQQTTVDEIESNVWKIMLEIGRLIIEWIIKSRGTGYSQRIISTPSGEAVYKCDVPKTITTLMGDITIQRAYYKKMNEKGGYVPLDKSLSIPKENCSYAVQEAMSLFAIEDSYAESAKKLSKLFPVKVSGGKETSPHCQDKKWAFLRWKTFFLSVMCLYFYLPSKTCCGVRYPSD